MKTNRISLYILFLLFISFNSQAQNSTCNNPLQYPCNLINNPGFESGTVPNNVQGHIPAGFVDCWGMTLCSGTCGPVGGGGNNTADIFDVNFVGTCNFVSNNCQFYNCFSITENSICQNTPSNTQTLNPPGGPNNRYAGLWKRENIGGSLTSGLTNGIYLADFWARGSDCLTQTELTTASVCTDLYWNCGSLNLGVITPLTGLSRTSWTHYYACLGDLTWIPNLSLCTNISFTMDYTFQQTIGRVLMDDCRLIKLPDAGDAQYTIHCPGGCIQLGSPVCTQPDLSFTYTWYNLTTGGIIGTTPNITVCPTQNTSYELDVEVFDALGNNLNCGSYTITDVIVLNDFSASTTVLNNASCGSSCDGSASVTVSIGNPPYTYNWSPYSSSTTSIATDLCAGNYAVTVTDANGCSATLTGNITQSSTLSSTVTIDDDVSCNGLCDGTAAITVTGGSPSYTYVWTPNVSTGPTAYNLCPGNYNVIVTDQVGCTTSNTITITEPPVLSLSSITTPTCGATSDGSVTILANGGTTPYVTYNWTPSVSTGPVALGLPVGSYTVIVTDANGCSATIVAIVAEATDCFTITKTAHPSTTYAGAPVDFEIVICNNTGSSQIVNIQDFLPSDFTPTSPNPFPPGGPLTILPASPQCNTYHVYGYFSTIGPCTDPGHINTVQLTQGSINIQDDACVNILYGCPFAFHGTGGCQVGDDVYLSLTCHVPVLNVKSMDLDFTYPAFLSPDNSGVFASIETGQYQVNNLIDFGTSSAVLNPTTWATVPIGYAAQNLHVEFDNGSGGPVNFYYTPHPYNWILKMRFKITAPVPTGQNVFPVWVHSPSTGLDFFADVRDPSGTLINTGYTAANYLTLQSCPSIPQLDATFSVQQDECPGGSVTVTANFSGPGIINNWTWGDNRTTPINGANFWTYDYFAWITQDGLGNPIIPPVAPASPGTYMITHTVINMLTGVSATSTQNITIPFVPIPDYSNYTINTGNSSIALSDQNSDGYILLDGILDVQDNYVISNSNLMLAANASIVVRSGSTLSLNNDILTGTCKDMWRGITVDDGASIVIRGCTIEDAIKAITADGSTSNTLVQVDDTRFNHNYIGISFFNGDFMTTNSNITNSSFSCSGGLSKSPHIGDNTLYHIYTEETAVKVGDETSLDYNYFYDADYGIYSLASKLTAYHNYFKNIGNFYFADFHSGIYAALTQNTPTILRVGSMSSSSGNVYENIFVDCYYGITAEGGVDAGIYKNNFSGGSTSILVNRNRVYPIDINTNTIYGSTVGIMLIDLSNCLLDVNNNSIVGASSSNGILGKIGIGFSSIYPNPVSMHYNSNVINDYRYGIHIINGSPDAYFDVNDNTINFNFDYSLAGAVDYRGIFMTNCTKPTISYNNLAWLNNGLLTALDINGYADQVQGMRLDNVNTGTLTCNSVTRCGTGMYFTGNCLGTYFINNTLEDNFPGMSFIDYSLPSAQGSLGNPAGNQWIGNMYSFTPGTGKVMAVNGNSFDYYFSGLANPSNDRYPVPPLLAAITPIGTVLGAFTCELANRPAEATTDSQIANNDFKLNESNKVSVYPNPSNEKITVLSNQRKIQFVSAENLLGERVLFQNINHTQGTVDISFMTNGTYILKIFLEDKTEIQKKLTVIH
jgi:hypothetical protein